MSVRDVRFDITAQDRTRGAFGTVRKQLSDTDRTVQGMHGRFAALQTSMAGAAATARTFAGAFGIGAVAGGLVALPAALRSVTSALAQMKAEAARAGVPVQEFQQLEYAAAQSKVSVDALTDGLKEMALRADEFIATGKGSGAEAFARLGFSASDLKERLEEPSELFLEIVGRLEQLDKAAQIRIADEIFGGTGGEQFVQMLGQGEVAVRDLMKEATDLGIVLDDELVDKAAEIDREWSNLERRFSSFAKVLSIEVVSAVAASIDQINALGAATDAFFRDPNLRNGLRFTFGDTVADYFTDATAGERIDQAFGAGGGTDADLAAALRRKALGGATTFTPIVPADEDKGRAKELKQAKDALDQVIVALEFEHEQLGRNALQQEIYNNLKRAGVALDSEAGQKIAELVKQNDALAGAQRQVIEAQEGAIEAQEFFKDLTQEGFNSIIMQGEDAAETVRGLAAALADAALQAVLFGEGPLSKLFGTSTATGGSGGFIGSIISAIMPGKADGGYISGAGGPRSDSIPALLSNGEFVVNAKATRAFRGLLEEINRGGLARMAMGGGVGSLMPTGEGSGELFVPAEGPR